MVMKVKKTDNKKSEQKHLNKLTICHCEDAVIKKKKAVKHCQCKKIYLFFVKRCFHCLSFQTKQNPMTSSSCDHPEQAVDNKSVPCCALSTL